MFLSVFEVLGEAFVELRHGVGPLLLAFFDLVEFFLEPRGVLHVEDVAEILDQQVRDDEANLRRRKFAAQLLNVLALLNCAQNRGVGGRTANAALFQFLHQRCFVVSRRRLGEVLLGLQFSQRKLLACLERRQLVLQFFCFFVLTFVGLFINFEETVKFQNRTGDPEPVTLVS